MSKTGRRGETPDSLDARRVGWYFALWGTRQERPWENDRLGARTASTAAAPEELVI